VVLVEVEMVEVSDLLVKLELLILVAVVVELETQLDLLELLEEVE
jgi:hypothetical protein